MVFARLRTGTVLTLSFGGRSSAFPELLPKLEYWE